MKKTIFFFLLLVLASCGNGSNTKESNDETSANSTTAEVVESISKDELKADIDFVTNYTYDVYSEKYGEFFNIDSVAQLVAEKLANFLLQNELTDAEAEALGLIVSAKSAGNEALKIYNLGYDSGGTSGTVDYPVLQWKSKAGDLFAYNFSKKLGCFFYEIQPLKNDSKNLYLLLGAEKLSGACTQTIAYGIEIKDKYLIIDNSFFVNRPYIAVCNVVFSFDTALQQLVGKPEMPVEYFNGEEVKLSVAEQGEYSTSEAKNAELATLLNGLYEAGNTITLKFDGQKFVK